MTAPTTSEVLYATHITAHSAPNAQFQQMTPVPTDLGCLEGAEILMLLRARSKPMINCH